MSEKAVNVVGAPKGGSLGADSRAIHVPQCSCCDGRAQVIWRDDPRDSDTWIIQTCDTCTERVCRACVAAISAEGFVQCVDCAQEEVICG